MYIKLAIITLPEIASTHRLTKSKIYYQWLAKQQIHEVSVTHINKLNLNELKTITTDTKDWWLKYCRRLAASHWFGLDKSIVQKELSLRGIKTRINNYEELILKLEAEKHRSKEPELDEDQKALLVAKDKHILLHAGPGAGKTTVLCALAAKRRNLGDQAIVFVVYTKAAQHSIEEKIRKYGISITPRRLMKFGKGLFVVTFHQYAYQRSPGKKAMGSYRATLTSGIEAGIQSWEKWDLLIIDEVQDITSEHEPLLVQIEKISKQSIYAGDARQQIYSGASFMPKIWNDKKYIKHYLRYNHRSHPKIVALLNIYSKTHFGKYHLEQIPDHSYKSSNRPPVAGLSISEGEKSYQSVGIIAADLCSDIANDLKAYVISPISTKKFKGTAEIVASFRERIIHNGAPYAKVLESGVSVYNPNEIVTNVGSSFLLKGTEADTVVVVQADIPYDKMIAPRAEIARLVYVALSRAKNNLKVIVNGLLESDGLLKCISNILNLKVGIVVKAKKEWCLDSLNVTEDMLDFDYLRLGAKEIDHYKLSALAQRSLQAPDFLGLLVEGHLANKLGVPPPNRCKVKRTNWGTSSAYVVDEELVVHIPIHSRLKEFKLEGHDEYILALIRYSIQADQVWTLGKEFSNDSFGELKPYVSTINQKLGVAKNRGYRRELKISAPRAPWMDRFGILVAITDIETDKYVIEVKHADDKPKHLTQVMVYAHMSSKTPVLVNTKTGTIRIFDIKPNISYLQIFARAVLASKQALGSRIHNKTPLRAYMSTETPDLMVAVDVEHTSKKKVLEIGAVAFSRGSGRVVSVYHQIASGVLVDDFAEKPGKKFEGVNKLCGFVTSNITSGANNDLVTDFKKWLLSLGFCVILQWAGSDAKILGLNVVDGLNFRLNGIKSTKNKEGKDNKLYISINVRTYFLRWLDLAGFCRKDKTSLGDAVEQLIYKDYFAAHRAFEDAVATMGVFLAMT